MNPEVLLLNTTESLRDFCGLCRQAPWVAFDTEFMRVRTYRPQLCLVQVATPTHIAVIDPMAPDVVMQPFYDTLLAPSVLKIIHAARQDLEIIVEATGRVPTPLFDTQVAAMVCGFGDSPSYGSLVQKLAGVTLDKSHQFTDWAARPLSAEKLRYAQDDVRYLGMLYEVLSGQIQRQARQAWIEDEMALLGNPATYRPDPRNAWQRIAARLEPARARLILQALAAWREEEAMRCDRPRQHVVKDEVLLALAKEPPVMADDIAERFPSLAKRHQESLYRCCQEASARPLEEAPESAPKRPRLKSKHETQLGLLKILLAHISETEGVAARLVANMSDLERFVLDPHARHPFLAGWRYDVFGCHAEKVMSGRLALRTTAEGLALVEHEPEEKGMG